MKGEELRSYRALGLGFRGGGLANDELSIPEV